MAIIEMVEDLSRCRFCRFFIVGGIGFLVDAGILIFLTGMGKGLVESRIVSFSIAVSVTWVMNRIWTFQFKSADRIAFRYALYVTGQIIGALINLIVFFLLITWKQELSALPVIPLAVGAGVAILINYGFSKFIVFRGG